MISRRQMLNGASAILGGGSAVNRRPPNVVLILSDDQRYDQLGCTGHPLVKTPHLDRLARQGSLFQSFFATSAVCMPARANLVTGQWERCHTVGGSGGRALSPAQWRLTFPSLLRQAGYFTGIIGKCNILGVRQDDIDYYCGSDDTALGFYPKEFGVGQSLFHGARSDTQLEVLGEAVSDFLGVDNGFYNRSLPAVQPCLGRRPADKPFLLYIATELPHGTGTRTIEQRSTDDPLYRTAYRDLAAQMPFVTGYTPRSAIRAPKLPPAVYSGIQHENYGYTARPESMREQEIRNCQTITGMDRLVGNIQQQLAAIGEADNTIIIFASDQGIMYGEHGYGGKALLYEPAIHIPLIIYDPRRAKRQPHKISEQLVVTADLAPTILELCDVPVPASMQGRSVVPLLDGKRPQWREDFFCENLMLSQDYPLVQGVRTRRWKYLRYWPNRRPPVDYREVLNLGLNGETPVHEELYDLQTDPHENTNLATLARHANILRGLRARCLHLQTQSLGRSPSTPLPSETIAAWRASMSPYYQRLATTNLRPR